MTNQEAFDKVVRGLASQGWKRSRDGQGCLYRQDGTPSCPVRCAYGWLIPDEAFEPEHNSDPIHHLPDTMQVDVDEEFARSLQLAHDYSKDGQTRAAFSDLATEEGLTWPADVP